MGEEIEENTGNKVEKYLKHGYDFTRSLLRLSKSKYMPWWSLTTENSENLQYLHKKYHRVIFERPKAHCLWNPKLN